MNRWDKQRSILKENILFLEYKGYKFYRILHDRENCYLSCWVALDEKSTIPCSGGGYDVDSRSFRLDRLPGNLAIKSPPINKTDWREAATKAICAFMDSGGDLELLIKESRAW